jgi:hypothetical protein
MNPLESLKAKLRPKPATDEQVMNKIKIKIPVESKPQKVAIQNIDIADVRGEHPDFDILNLTKKLKENKRRFYIINKIISIEFI